MNSPLRSGYIAPQSRTCKSVLVFLHGYGANGDDLLSLAAQLHDILPDTAFYAPNASDPCLGQPNGFRWFPVPWLDGAPEAKMIEDFCSSISSLNSFLDAILEKENIGAERLALFGFSQGCMLALHIGPRRKEKLAGIVGFSGCLLESPSLPGKIQSKPPIFLAHGTQDETVPFASMKEALQGFDALGINNVESYIMEGAGHTISADGFDLARAFLSRHLGAHSSQ